MARREYRGGAPQLILSGSLAASGEVTINTTGTVTNWPTGATGKFLIVIDKGTASEEKIFCNGRVVNALSIASDADRGADGTSAATHSPGATINHVGGAIDLDEPNDHINDTAEDHHTQYLNTARFQTAHDVEARHTFGAAYGTPVAPADVADTAAAGSGNNPAREDHVHARPAAMPRGVLDKVEKTTSALLGTSQADISGLTVTVTTVASRRYRVTANVPLNVFSSVAGSGAARIFLMEGATQLANGMLTTNDQRTSSAGSVILQWVSVPSAGSHTYKCQGLYEDGTDPTSVAATATIPATIYVEDIGI